MKVNQEELQRLIESFKSVYKSVFGKEYDGEDDLIKIALLIRNELKVNEDVNVYSRNRFNRLVREIGAVDYRLAEMYLKLCV